MRRQGLEGISPPRRFRPVARIGEAGVHSVPDSDITYLRTGEGWMCLCAVGDAWWRRVTGWAMNSTQTSALVERAFRMAYILRGGGLSGVVFHADRGT